jgi:hypothetical protein
VKARQLAQLVTRIADGTLPHNAARQVFDALWTGEGSDVDAIIEAKDLKPMADTGALDKILDEVIAKNAKNVEEYRGGKEKALNGLVGQVMEGQRGQGEPGAGHRLAQGQAGLTDPARSTEEPALPGLGCCPPGSGFAQPGGYLFVPPFCGDHSAFRRTRSSSKRAFTRFFSSSCSAMKRFCTATLCVLSSSLRRTEPGALPGSCL